MASWLPLRPWQTRTHCCEHIVARDVSWAAQTGKQLLQTQNVSEQRHKICVRNKCCACGQTGKHLCRQQCVGNNVSSFATAFSLEPCLGCYGGFFLWLSEYLKTTRKHPSNCHETMSYASQNSPYSISN